MNITTKKLTSSVTNKILLMKFAAEFILIYPFVTIMYGDHGHVSSAGIGTILAVGTLLFVMLEIPAGILADKAPRKYILAGSLLFKILAFAIWIVMPYFAGYLLAAVVFALSKSLESGTIQAYLYSALGVNDKRSFGKFWARVNSMMMISYTIAYTLTAIVGVRYNLLIVLSILPCVIAFFICLSLPVDRMHIPSEIRPSIFKGALRHIKTSPNLIQLLLGGVVVVALADTLIEYLSLYYKQSGVEIRIIPLVMAVGNIIGATLFWTLHSWEDMLNRRKSILLFLACVIFGASFYGGVIITATGFLLFTRFIRVLQVQYESNIQHLSNDKTRATISSISSFTSSFMGAGIMLAIGFSANNSTITGPVRVASIAGSFVYIVFQFRKTNPTIS